MTDLSPAAQAVFAAWAKPVDVDRSLVISGQALVFQARSAVAAALRAAADQVVPEHPMVVPGGRSYEAAWSVTVQDKIRNDLLAIAAELEGAND